MLSFAAPLFGKPVLRDIRITYGPLGPIRESTDVVAGDELYFRFIVDGLRTETGKIDVELRLQVISSEGKAILDQRSPLNDVLALGGNSFAGTASVSLGSKFPTGDYTYKLTITDNLAEESVSFERKFKCVASKFALVRPRFTHDKEGTSPAGSHGFVGELLHFRLHAIGFEREQGKIKLAMEIQTFDKAGKPQMPKPQRFDFLGDDAAKVATAEAITLQGFIALNRAGEFTLQITVLDDVGNQKALIRVPIVVKE
jgi:hypothetical protein